jgi:hypothetical protein
VKLLPRTSNCRTWPVGSRTSSTRTAESPRTYDSFRVFGTTLAEKIGVFHLSFQKMVPISPDAS